MLLWSDPFRDKLMSHQNFGTHISLKTKTATKVDFGNKDSRGQGEIFGFEVSCQVDLKGKGDYKFRRKYQVQALAFQAREHNLISRNIVQLGDSQEDTACPVCQWNSLSPARQLRERISDGLGEECITAAIDIIGTFLNVTSEALASG